MKKLFTAFLCIFLCVITSIVNAQQRQVSGSVKDEAGKVLSGATVGLKGTQNQVATNDLGVFTINVPNGAAVLSISYSGLQAKEINIGERETFVSVSLQASPSSIDNVVVVAYGRQKQATVTGSVSSIVGKELVSNSVSNISNMLVGNAPGLSGLQTSGEPGRNGANIFIRGVSTFSGNNNPLIVIDGVEQAAEQAFAQFNSIDANEIENISILKDASSTAVYGIRGANGVIIVTTKRGRIGKPTLSLSSNYGVTKATDLMHNVNSYQYATMRNEAIRVEQSTFGSSGFNAYLFDANDIEKMRTNRDYLPSEVAALTNLSDAQKAQLNNSPALYYGSHDLFAEQFSGKGPQKQLNLNISGGTQKIKYFTSLGYFDQSSILTNTKYAGANTASTYNRYNFRSNVDIDVVKNLTISVNIAGQFGTTAGPAIGAGPYDLAGRYKIIMQYIFDSNPLTAPGLVDGKLVNSYQGVGGSVSNPLGIKLGSLKGNQNPIRNLLASGNENLFNTLLSNSIVARYNLGYLVKGLSLRATANYDDYYVKAITYAPSLPEYAVRRNPANPNEFQFYGGAIGANSFNADPGHNSTWRKIYYDAGIDYSTTFKGGHSITALVLGKAQRYNLPAGTEYTPSGIMGLVGRVTYNYKDRYLAEFNAGYNGTEQFIEGKRFGYFPAYSAGWVISNEPLFPKNDWITFLKVRASYGEVGNDQIGSRRYLYLPSTYLTGQAGFYWGNSNGSVTNPYYSGNIEGTIGNPNVTWERAIKKNIGIEAKFLRNRVSFSIDVFKDRRDDILTTLGTIPYVYGVASSSIPPVNVGKTTNHGYELVLGWADRTRNFSYYITGNINYARNKIVYQAEAPKAYPWMLATGYAIGQYKGLLTDGFFNSQDDIINAPYNSYNANKVALGDVRYKDINGDGIINQKDVVPIGFSNLPQYTMSLKAGFAYKGFDVSSLFTGTAKGSFNLANYAFNTPFFQVAGNVMQWQYDGRWTPDKVKTGQQALYPRATVNGGAGGNSNFLTSDLWLLSSDFMRLKNIEVGYTIPSQGLLKKANISAVRIYANANNLFTWNSKLQEKGLDPESTDVGGYGVYPITRVVVVGANIRF